MFSSLVSSQPLLSSQDRASLAEETELGEEAARASRSDRGKKLRVLCGDVALELLLSPREDAQAPVFCFEESPISSQGGKGETTTGQEHGTDQLKGK